MITISVLGGLGNQMFQYAAGKALAERHGVDLALDLSGFTDNKLTPRPFLLDRLGVPEAAAFSEQAKALKAAGYYARARWKKRIGRVFGRVGLPKLGLWPHDYCEPHFHYDPPFETLGPDTTLWGYFQSERYFSSIASNLREWLSPREPLAGAAVEMFARIEASRLPVSVHVRRGDYLDPGRAEFHGIVAEPYYREALGRLEGALGAAAELFIFSDDPAAAEQVLNFVPRSRLVHVRGEPDRPWEDIALMARCRHHIIANSSFSWWGAWLNGAPEKIVVAPRNWFASGQLSKWNTCDVYPPGWLRV
jgi:Glycosyl transferase family 11